MKASQPTTQSKDLLTIQQAAAYALCSESTIKRRIHSGELPAVTNGETGRKCYVTREDVDALFKDVNTSEEERMKAIARSIAAGAPKLSPERKAKLASLLS